MSFATQQILITIRASHPSMHYSKQKPKRNGLLTNHIFESELANFQTTLSLNISTSKLA